MATEELKRSTSQQAPHISDLDLKRAAKLIKLECLDSLPATIYLNDMMRKERMRALEAVGSDWQSDGSLAAFFASRLSMVRDHRLIREEYNVVRVNDGYARVDSDGSLVTDAGRALKHVDGYYTRFLGGFLKEYTEAELVEIGRKHEVRKALESKDEKRKTPAALAGLKGNRRYALVEYELLAALKAACNHHGIQMFSQTYNLRGTFKEAFSDQLSSMVSRINNSTDYRPLYYSLSGAVGEPVLPTELGTSATITDSPENADEEALESIPASEGATVVKTNVHASADEADGQKFKCSLNELGNSSIKPIKTVKRLDQSRRKAPSGEGFKADAVLDAEGKPRLIRTKMDIPLTNVPAAQQSSTAPDGAELPVSTAEQVFTADEATRLAQVILADPTKKAIMLNSLLNTMMTL